MLKQRHIRHAIGIVLLALILRKVIIGHNAMSYVAEYKHQILTEKMTSDAAFILSVASLSEEKPALILILNQHALNMTLNWLCNTVMMPEVHERAVIVTLDEESDIKLAQLWPNVKRLHWRVDGLADPFNYGDGKYQLFYLFRANLARAFLHFGKPFWMIQQDTFWRKSLLELPSYLLNDSYDIVFDRAADTKGSLIAGGYYLANANNGTRNYFNKLATDLEWSYVPDNTYMTTLCSMEDLANCGQLPFSTVTNWIWLHEPSRMKGVDVPWLVQFDGDTRLGGKLAKMRSLGFYFLKNDGITCSETSVIKAQKRVVKWSGVSGSIDATDIRSYSHLQFGLYQAIVDVLYQFSWTESLLHNVIFPYAHYFMITL
ncbi:unnamed protein product [Bursaphelenchus okinawaensis]|uniref:Nucleotide-diphospho-sugar transferase domain-containing protein n=1 Tax=Bursaphelenchus okinawaensis TaxID=465554 RepID=A0A811LMQ3_9BILA|nr:unnamed protein product [Bursaphelenchus okinawaensis]CAG9126503.1 unnamed protein product [Bursaphelenchus okinawaensis]